jgi:hypothetical protein
VTEPSGEADVGAAYAPVGSYVHLYWREAADLPGDVPRPVLEYPLFTDARVVGEPQPLGPYRLLNTVADRAGNREVPAMHLRVTSDQIIRPIDWRATRAEHYHGGTANDEIAALLSLEAGMRAAVGDAPVRIFQPDGDPYGRPYAFVMDRQPPRVRDPGPAARVPAVTGTRDVSDLPRLVRFAELDGGDAIAVVKAARLYQEALWLAESAPELAWLLLVSAAEAAAVHAEAQDGTDLERLEAWSPDLAVVLRSTCGDAALAEAARLIAPVTGATRKFVAFMQRFAPTTLPEPRPAEAFRVDLGSSRKRGDLYSRVYGYRSLALHAGRPFPGPMCRGPGAADERGGTPERPFGPISAFGTAVWHAKDIPILLNTFAVLVRDALLAWWGSLLPPVNGAGRADGPVVVTPALGVPRDVEGA